MSSTEVSVSEMDDGSRVVEFWHDEGRFGVGTPGDLSAPDRGRWFRTLPFSDGWVSHLKERVVVGTATEASRVTVDLSVVGDDAELRPSEARMAVLLSAKLTGGNFHLLSHHGLSVASLPLDAEDVVVLVEILERPSDEEASAIQWGAPTLERYRVSAAPLRATNRRRWDIYNREAWAARAQAGRGDELPGWARVHK